MSFNYAAQFNKNLKGLVLASILCGSSNLIVRSLINAAYSFRQHGPVDTARQPFTFSKNINFVGRRSALTIAMELLLG